MGGSPVCDAVCWRERLPTLSVVRLQIPVLVAGRVRLYTKRQTLLSVCLGGTPAVDVRGRYIRVGIEVRFALLIMSYIVAMTTGIMSSATRTTVMRAGVRHGRMVFCIFFPTTVGED